MFAERGLAQHRLGGFMTEADRWADMPPPRLVTADHAARYQIRMREGFRQRVDAAVADIELRQILLPFRERFLAEFGGEEVVIGMAHRGRLNVLANVLKKPASQIFAEFQDKLDEKVDLNDGGGDVKYHLGFSIDRTFGEGPDEHRVHLSLTFNPSHLEWVNTVVQGRVRAKQDRLGDAGRTRALPILIHGDAAFAGQGIIAESLNMSELDGYRVGGTVHIIVNKRQLRGPFRGPKALGPRHPWRSGVTSVTLASRSKVGFDFGQPQRARLLRAD